MRSFKLAAVQLGPINTGTKKSDTVDRLISLLNKSADQGAKLVVFPELGLCPFFPRQTRETIPDDVFESYFEKSNTFPDATLEKLFDAAKKRQVGFYLGFAELDSDTNIRYNAAVLVDNNGRILQKYRKTHLPGFDAPKPGKKFQQLEKQYFAYGDSGFKGVRTNTTGGDGEWIEAICGLLICNDRRWAEAWRCYGLQGVELVMCGYNTASNSDLFDENKQDRLMQSQVVMRANCYMNATWGVAVAKAGCEDGQEMMGGTHIVDPKGHVVAEASSEDDEIVIANVDLDESKKLKEGMFDLGRHRRPEFYTRIIEQVGIVEP